MDQIVPRNPQNAALLGALTSVFINEIRDISRERAQALARGFVHTIEQHGRSASNEVYHMVRQIGANAGTHGRQLVRTLQRSVNDAINSVHTNWDDFMNQSPAPSPFERNVRPRIEDSQSNLQDQAQALAERDAQRAGIDLDNFDASQFQFDDPMGEPEQEPEATPAAARAAGGFAGGNTPSKETPIVNPSAISYGLQETHTTILPWTGWLSVGGLTKRLPAQLRIRMNCPYDMLDVTLQSDPPDAAFPSTLGFYGDAFDTNGAISSNASGDFPERFIGGTVQATERPAWRDYWAELYSFYTVLGCEYEIILYNPQQAYTGRVALLPHTNAASVMTAGLTSQLIGPSKLNTDIVCAVQKDSYSDAQGITGNVMPITNYSEIRAFKHIDWYPVEGGSKKVIRGTYKPGQIKRNIVNDGDVKTWTSTDVSGGISGAYPNLKDMLTLNFFQDPFFNARGPDTYNASGTATATGAARTGCCNIEVNVKYIVQYKDLKQQARYPNTATSVLDIIQTLNEDPSARGTALQQWG